MDQLSSTWFKLRDQRDNYLGILSVHPRTAEYLLQTDRSVTVYKRQPPLGAYVIGPQHVIPDITVDVFHVVPANYPHHRDSVMLFGITPDDISQESGFAFLPSAEYLRRPVEAPKAKERQPTASGPYLNAAREVAG